MKTTTYVDQCKKTNLVYHLFYWDNGKQITIARHNNLPKLITAYDVDNVNGYPLFLLSVCYNTAHGDSSIAQWKGVRNKG